MIESNVSIHETSQNSTKSRILDVAERLFAEHGFEATSLRMITAEAGVNLAAVNYHFHSKDALIEAVFERRIRPLNQERIRLLEECEAKAERGLLPLEGVIRAFVAPVVRIRQEAAVHGVDIARIFGRTYSEASESVRRSFFGLMREISRPFTAAFRRALPELPLTELLWRIHFSIGVLAHTLAGTQHLQIVSGGLCDPSDIEGTIDRMVAFVAAGMRSPSPLESGQRS